MGSQVGAEKVAAKRIGVSLDEWRERRSAGEKWCTTCKAWHPVGAFPVDRSRGDGRRARCVQADHGKPRSRRDPVKERARNAVSHAVRKGRLEWPDRVPCVDCGHVGDDRRHEYDHHKGYTPEHHLDVEAVCTLCHADREKVRRG